MTTDPPRIRFALLLARLDNLQMYNRMDAHGLANGRAAARQIAAELRTVGAQLTPKQRRRALAEHAHLRPGAKSHYEPKG